MGKAGEAGSLGGVLANEAVGVLIGAALPGVVRGREEEGDAGGGLDAFVAMELGAVVDGDGAGGSRGGVDEANGRSVGGFDGAGLELADPSEAGPAIDEGEEYSVIH